MRRARSVSQLLHGMSLGQAQHDRRVDHVRRRGGSDGGHELAEETHAPDQGTSQRAQVYPKPLGRAILRGLRRALKESGQIGAVEELATAPSPDDGVEWFRRWRPMWTTYPARTWIQQRFERLDKWNWRGFGRRRCTRECRRAKQMGLGLH